jgi:hypothetical protein
LPRDEFGNAMAEGINILHSYMLTDVIVQNIYYKGEKININENDIISIAEWCVVYPQNKKWCIQENMVGDDILYIWENVEKLIPGNEYLIFGYQYMDHVNDFRNVGDYCTIEFWEGIVEINNGDYEYSYESNRFSNNMYSYDRQNPIVNNRNKYSDNYFASSNADQIINDYLEQYRNFVYNN